MVRYADGPTIEASVHVGAPPERLWPLVSDIALVASISPELQEARWLDGDGPPAVGRRFRGRNRHPAVGEWTTVSQVVECEPGRVFAWVVGDPENPTATWCFELTPTADGGTELRQWARMGPGPSNLTPVIEAHPDKEERIVARRLAEWQAGIDANLAAFARMAQA